MLIPILQDRCCKPPLGTPLRSDGHWSVQGLVSAWALNEGAGSRIFDMCSGSQSNFVGGAWTGGVLNTASVAGNGAIVPSVPLTNKITVISCTTVGVSLSDQHLISRYNGWVLSGDGTNLRFRIDGAVSVSFGSLASLKDSRYHTFCGVYDGTNVITYTDGRRINSSPRTGNMTLAGNTTLCTYNGGTGFEWSGKVLFALLFNRDLSPAEIASLSANHWQIYEPEVVWVEVGGGGLSSVYSSLALPWDMFEQVYSSLSVKWDILNTISSDLSVKFDTLNSVFADLAVKWDVFAGVEGDLTIVFDTRNLVSSDLTAIWDATGMVFSGLTIKWDLGELGGRIRIIGSSFRRFIQ